MTEYREIAVMLRRLIKNTESPEDTIEAHHVLALSQTLDEMADSVEMDMIIEMQRKELV